MNSNSMSWSDALAAMMVSLLAVFISASAGAAPYATEWVAGHNSKSRLIIGGALSDDGTVVRYAALEISLEPEWKTYWRQPGSAGGIPPYIDWRGSTNIASIEVLFPAPIRMTDPNGDTIGYKKSVTFPIRLEVVDPGKPISLDIKVFFGVCREICIPADAQFKVSPPSHLFMQTPPGLADALAKLPVPSDPAAADIPRLAGVTTSAGSGNDHVLTFEVAYPGGIEKADLFVESGDKQPMPMTRAVGRTANTVRYKLVLDAQDWQAVGKTGLLLTMVSPGAASYQQVARPAQ